METREDEMSSEELLQEHRDLARAVGAHRKKICARLGGVTSDPRLVWVEEEAIAEGANSGVGPLTNSPEYSERHRRVMKEVLRDMDRVYPKGRRRNSQATQPGKLNRTPTQRGGGRKPQPTIVRLERVTPHGR